MAGRQAHDPVQNRWDTGPDKLGDKLTLGELVQLEVHPYQNKNPIKIRSGLQAQGLLQLAFKKVTMLCESMPTLATAATVLSL